MRKNMIGFNLGGKPKSSINSENIVLCKGSYCCNTNKRVLNSILSIRLLYMNTIPEISHLSYLYDFNKEIMSSVKILLSQPLTLEMIQNLYNSKGSIPILEQSNK